MGARRRSWWLVWALGALLTLGALSWISVVVIDLETSEREAREVSAQQERVRLALWRMDSWFGAQLATEVARLPREYQAYSPQPLAYTKILSQIEPGEVMVPSPLLSFESEIIRIHFQLGRKGWSSPQLPVGNQLDLAQANGLAPAERLAARREALEELAAAVTYEEFDTALSGAVRSFNQLFVAQVDLEQQVAAAGDSDRLQPLGLPPLDNAPRQQEALAPEWNGLNVQERAQRAESFHQLQNPNFPPIFNNDRLDQGAPDASASSALVPLWLNGDGFAPRLCFVRRVTTSEGDVFQGFFADWQRLEEELLARVTDLLPAALLEPRLDANPEADPEGHLMATIPAALQSGRSVAASSAGMSPAVVTLLFTWLAALVALGAVGVSLRSSIAYGEQRSRFASTVTHELRTPLTTFRMYSEMLARGMVPEEKRGEYLATLERESDRLATLVENVLAYSRLEDGRASLRRERTLAAELVERVRPELERRATEAGMELHLDVDGARGIAVETDSEAVEQILFNLVDNACKYGRGEGGGRIELLAEGGGGILRLRIRDHGSGVPPKAARAIFQAFDRGGLDPADENPGVGLGLALSRGLARDLGGDLVLENREPGEGAAFCLTLPRAS